jgi:hypothetical protein
VPCACACLSASCRGFRITLGWFGGNWVYHLQFLFWTNGRRIQEFDSLKRVPRQCSWVPYGTTNILCLERFPRQRTDLNCSLSGKKQKQILH